MKLHDPSFPKLLYFFIKVKKIPEKFTSQNKTSNLADRLLLHNFQTNSNNVGKIASYSFILNLICIKYNIGS